MIGECPGVGGGGGGGAEQPLQNYVKLIFSILYVWNAGFFIINVA